MATYKIHKTRDYTVMSNIHLRDKKMSLKAKGLLSVMLSLPDNWDYSINGLVAICKENNTAVENALIELKTLGYLVVTKKLPNTTESGRIEYEYDIYESPQEAQKQAIEKQGVEKQGVENQGVEFQGVENGVQLSTNVSITKKSNTNKSNTDDKKERKNTTYDEILTAVSNPELRELYREYIKMRKMIKAPMTDRALKMLIDRVNQIEPNDIEKQKRMIETAIMNNWKSVYPIKEEQKSNVNTSRNTSGNVFLDLAKDEGLF